MIDEIAVENADTPIFNIHELRRTAEGRAMLREVGKAADSYVTDISVREFVGWDGEGITYDQSLAQSYVLFGASSGHYVQGPALATVECLELLLRAGHELPNRIHVGFAFSYDVEMILKDVPYRAMRRLYRDNSVRWGKYRLEYIPNKWFSVSGNHDGKWRTIRVWDIFSFFGSSFVKALEQYLVDVPELEQIAEGKEARGTFQYAQLETFVKPYWETELTLLVRLADKLRQLLYDAGLCIKHWHGPGALASFLFTHNGTDHYRKQAPGQVLDAAQYAFAGGRFELFRIGRANQKVYKYDINSAYPAGITQLPSLAAEWRHEIQPKTVERFGVYCIAYDAMFGSTLTDPHLLFYRDKNSCIHYPQRVVGWYWSPEARIMADHPHAEILEGWVLEDTDEYPFQWVQNMYDTRAQWKKDKVQAQWALKLGMNSLYGKMAQRVGWKIDRLPRWHQLEWAGYVTSHTRAILWAAVEQANQKGALIACETDAVFSSEPLDLPISDKLGEWDFEVYDDIVYLQNGVYWLKTDDEWKPKFRGMDPKSLPIEDVLSYLEGVDMRKPRTNRGDGITGTTTRFIGGKLAMHTDITRWRKWETEPREIKLGVDGKRSHRPSQCRCCSKDDYIPPSETMHDLSVTKFWGGSSKPHDIPWREMEAPEWADYLQPTYTQ